MKGIKLNQGYIAKVSVVFPDETVMLESESA